MKGFDGQFVLAWILKQGMQPKVIPNGSKIMSICLPTFNIRVIDSFNFLPMGLSKLPKTFGMQELKKGFSPHIFNTRENQNYVGKYPDQHFYMPDAMNANQREEFLVWYKRKADDEFDFQKEIIDYCRYDFL